MHWTVIPSASGDWKKFEILCYIPPTSEISSFPLSLCYCLATHLSASHSFSTMALCKSIYLLTYLLTYLKSCNFCILARYSWSYKCTVPQCVTGSVYREYMVTWASVVVGVRYLVRGSSPQPPLAKGLWLQINGLVSSTQGESTSTTTSTSTSTSRSTTISTSTSTSTGTSKSKSYNTQVR